MQINNTERRHCLVTTKTLVTPTHHVLVLLCIGRAVVCIAFLTHSTLAYKVTNKNHLSPQSCPTYRCVTIPIY
jgi:hypothetical protein